MIKSRRGVHEMSVHWGFGASSGGGFPLSLYKERLCSSVGEFWESRYQKMHYWGEMTRERERDKDAPTS